MAPESPQGRSTHRSGPTIRPTVYGEVAFSPDQTKILIPVMGGYSVYDAMTGEQLASLPSRLSQAWFSADGERIIFMTGANEAQDWAWAGGSFHTPVDGGVLPSNAPFEFTWQADVTVDPPAAGAPNDLQIVHLLVFGSATEPNLLRVFSTLDSYTPDAAAWDKLK